MADPKLPSEVLQPLRQHLEQAMKDSPDIIEHVIHKRNKMIACLKAEKEHMLVVFKEITQRYNDVSEQLDSKILDLQYAKKEIERIKEEITTLSLSSKSSQDIIVKQNNMFQGIKAELVKIKTEKEKLETIIKVRSNELEDIKIRLAINLNENKNTFGSKLNTLVDKMPKNFIKHVIKFLISDKTFKFTVFLAFCFMFCVSIIGWSAVFVICKALFAIFL